MPYYFAYGSNMDKNILKSGVKLKINHFQSGNVLKWLLLKITK